jgi:imidazolonepropionase-like amidohydrolase
MGVKLVPGDDYGTELLPHAPGGYARELALYAQELGCGETKVLRWATANGSELLGLRADGGLMCAGAPADLCILNGDPLANIEMLQEPWTSVDAVFRAGLCIYRRSLRDDQ